MKRILIIGQDRSGTKFSTNLIAANFHLSCIQSNAHGGVIETNLLYTYEKIFGKHPTYEQKRAALHMLSGEDFYKFSSLDSLKPVGLDWDSFDELFTKLMDAHAANEQAEGWVHKSFSQIGYLIASMPVTVILLIRHIPDVVHSSMQSKGRSDLRFILSRVASTLIVRKAELFTSARNGWKVCNYDDIVADKEGFVLQVSEYAGISPLSELQDTQFNNSRFSSSSSRPEVPKGVLVTYKLFRLFTFLIPDSICYLLVTLRLKLTKGATVVKGSFTNME